MTSETDGFVCVQHGKVVPDKRVLLNIVIDDGTESIRSVLFNEALEPFGNLEDVNQRQSLLGKEMLFYGSVRNNNFFNNTEFIIEKVEELNFDELIKKLEGS